MKRQESKPQHKKLVVTSQTIRALRTVVLSAVAGGGKPETNAPAC